MATPIEWAIILTAATAGTAAYSSYQQGRAQRAFYEEEARNAETQAKQARVAAAQAAAENDRELAANLAAINASAAARNTVGGDASMSYDAIVRSFTRQSLAAKATEVANIKAQQVAAMRRADQARGQGDAAFQAGVLGAAGDLLGGAAQIRGFVPAALKARRARRTGGP